jgi:hypothetical protein
MEPTLKKRKTQQDLFKTLSIDELTIIFKFCDPVSIFQLIQTKKEISEIFKNLKSESIENLRLWYLNNQPNDRIKSNEDYF